MDYKRFIKLTVMGLDEENFELLRKALLGNFVEFTFFDDSDVSKEILSEKLCDYFEKLEFKNGKSFDKFIASYISDLDSVVGNRIAKAPQTKKKDPNPVTIPRARKYYEKAISVKNTRGVTVQQIKDYTRIMMCLYAEIINNGYTEISNMDYSVSKIEPDTIIASMKNEADTTLIHKNPKLKFDIEERYCSDTCTFVIALIIMYAIIGDKVQGEYYHE